MGSDLHVIFGTGPVGMATVELLAAGGHRVRVVDHSGRAGVPSGVEVRGGDASDSGFSRNATEGAAIVYPNPPKS